jgi:NarL family two-component system sensor histidine kinase LiaS
MTRRLQRLARAAQAWSRGDFSVAVKDRSKDEIGQLSRELNQMAAQLEGLIQARQELATLETRNRFARDLHDSVKQQVFATSFQVAAARALIEDDSRAAEAHLAQAEELARQAQRELNVLIGELRPAALEGKGLSSALRDYVEDWSRRAEILAEVHVRGEREIPLEVEQALFRVAQEALANVAKHSGAGNVEVDLVYAPGSLTLRVDDDGRGFDPARNPDGGFGLQSMHERLEKLGGRVEIESVQGKGTTITCVCPLEDSSKDGR